MKKTVTLYLFQVTHTCPFVEEHRIQIRSLGQGWHCTKYVNFRWPNDFFIYSYHTKIYIGAEAVSL